MSKVELLAPAGNRETLETAFYFGADAAYMAGQKFGLRAFADNFGDEDMKDAVAFAHRQQKKIYVTVNAVLYNEELEDMKAYLLFLAGLHVDGVILSDPAVVELARKNEIDLSLHLSTQANAINYLSAMFWHRNGIKRIVMSREASLAQIAEVRKRCPQSMEIEAFVHGAMCIAHSGRCLLSSVMTGRSGNKGECAQPCRWRYSLHEEGYEGQYFPIDEDGRGTYILNSKDLMMIDYIPQMIEAGIGSFKIEGRMKSTYYVASVVSAYRRAIDAYYSDPEHYMLDEKLKDELVKTATRGFTSGFFFGNPGGESQDTVRETDYRKYTFAGIVRRETQEGFVTVEQRNKFSVGETLEILSPHLQGAQFSVESIQDMEGMQQESAPHAQQMVRVNCPYVLQPGDILRRHD